MKPDFSTEMLTIQLLCKEQDARDHLKSRMLSLLRLRLRKKRATSSWETPQGEISHVRWHLASLWQVTPCSDILRMKSSPRLVCVEVRPKWGHITNRADSKTSTASLTQIRETTVIYPRVHRLSSCLTSCLDSGQNLSKGRFFFLYHLKCLFIFQIRHFPFYLLFPEKTLLQVCCKMTGLEIAPFWG